MLREQQEIMKEQQRQLQTLRETLAPPEAITAPQIKALEARLEALHASKLLTDDELFSLEVLI